MVNHVLQDDQDKPVVVPTVDVAAFGGFEGKDAAQMLAAAEEADRADHELGIRQALRKYKVAVFWAMFLSCALIMEGYDVVVIGSFYGQPQFIKRFGSVGSDGVMAIQGMSTAFSSTTVTDRPFSQRNGKHPCPTPRSAVNSSVSLSTVSHKIDSDAAQPISPE